MIAELGLITRKRWPFQPRPRRAEFHLPGRCLVGRFLFKSRDV